MEIPWLDNQPVTNKGANDRILNVLPFSTNKSGFDEYNTIIESIITAFRIRLENKVSILYCTRGTLQDSIPTDPAIAPDWIGPKGERLLQIISSIFLDVQNKKLKIRFSNGHQASECRT